MQGSVPRNRKGARRTTPKLLAANIFGQPKYLHLAVARQITEVRKCGKRSISGGSVAAPLFSAPFTERSLHCRDISVIY